MSQITSLFDGWDETMIWSCLQGCMGEVLVDCEEHPTAAQIVLGDFCFFAGQPNVALVEKAAAPILTPQNEAWALLIAQVFGNRVQRGERYAIKKETDVFDQEKLTQYVKSLGQEYELKLFDHQIYEQAMKEDWSADFCSVFVDARDYLRRGLGVAVLHQGNLVAGASSYCVYCGGIEIEVDTKAEYRRQGLATACGAKLILECLHRGLYPSWDAQNLQSLALAEKLGYHLKAPYPIYLLKRAHT